MTLEQYFASAGQLPWVFPAKKHGVDLAEVEWKPWCQLPGETDGQCAVRAAGVEDEGWHPDTGSLVMILRAAVALCRRCGLDPKKSELLLSPVCFESLKLRGVEVLFGMPVECSEFVEAFRIGIYHDDVYYEGV